MDKNLNYLLILIPLFVLFSCHTEDGCSGVTVCTEEFRSITVTITQNGQPFKLDYFKTIHEQTGKVYDFSGRTDFINNDRYVLLTDGQMGELEKNGSWFRLEGGIQDTVLVSETYLIGHDCCHIVLVSGPTEIEIK
ncbi:MAG: hypothetical protein OEY56_12345 [Cyclobacteriaceae bacterium]|nr:hypothetical protein [Cyclobacteriaceae bacterium]